MRARSAVGVLLAVLLAGSAVVTAAPVQAEPVQVEPVQVEPVQVEPVQVEPVQVEPVQVISAASPLDCDGVVAVPDGYLLTKDTECNLEGLGSGKSVDLGGYTLTSRPIIPWFSRGVKVHDGTILIRGSMQWLGIDSTFSRVRIRPAPDVRPDGFFMAVGDGFTLEHSVVEDVPGIAFDLYRAGNGTTFRNSVFRNNGAPFSIQKSSDVVIEGNWFIENGTGVNLWPEDGNGVNGNVIRRNVFVANGTAVYMLARCYSSTCTYISGRGPALDNTLIQQNLIVNSRFSGMYIIKACEMASFGAQCISATGNQIAGNIIIGSAYDPAVASPYDDGITARGSYRTSGFPTVETPHPEALAGFTLSGNLAIHNAGLGFDVFGVTDGGRNLAFLNGNPDQCDGVRCTLRRPPHRAPVAGPALEDALFPPRSHSEAAMATED